MAILKHYRCGTLGNSFISERKCCTCGKIFLYPKRFKQDMVYCNLTCLVNRNNILQPLNALQKEVLIGSMLGDGTINVKNTPYFSKKQSENRKEYLIWHQQILKDLSAPKLTYIKKGYENLPGGCYKCQNQWLFRTRSLPELKDWYADWYKDKVKIVPSGLRLTPLIMAIWFCDDGCNCPKTRNVYFSTQSFTENECEKLCLLIDKHFNIKFYINIDRKNQPLIRCRTNHYFNFIDLIKPYVIWDCFQYKTDISLYRPYLNAEELKQSYKNRNINHQQYTHLLRMSQDQS